jgi:hypothetical protein
MPSSATAQSSHSPSTTTGARKEDPAKTVDRVVRYLTLPDGEVTLCAPLLLLLPPPLELCTALNRASTLGAELTTGTAGPATPWCLASRVGAAIPPKENDRKTTADESDSVRKTCCFPGVVVGATRGPFLWVVDPLKRSGEKARSAFQSRQNLHIHSTAGS